MSSTKAGPDPRRLDIERAARHAQHFQGRWPLAELARLHESPVPAAGEVVWSAQCSERPRPGGAPQVRLRLEASAVVERVCQRCLQPVMLPLEVQRDFLFVAGEALAAELDADNDEEDVLELTRSLDLRALVEDELLLALPLVPRHEVCSQPLQAPATPLVDTATAAHPFAVLERLRRSGPS